mmetsp:Transcript_16852/g.39173  ORF Transcript_16852/g.39173 Transcript_16852/m.39173 type:complete len:234 (+) Transcript_16852:314-1015(+)
MTIFRPLITWRGYGCHSKVTLACRRSTSDQKRRVATVSAAGRGFDERINGGLGGEGCDVVRPPVNNNIKLEAIKAAGVKQLHNFTQDLTQRSSQPLFGDEDYDPVTGRPKLSIAQKQEASRLETAVVESFVHYSSKHTTFSIKGHVIDILGVDVSQDLRAAKVYWCLPLNLDLDKLPHSKVDQLIRQMQQLLEEKGGHIQGSVHTRLGSHYTPRLSFCPGEHISRDLSKRFTI